MAVRIRKDGRIFCAAMHPKEEGDIYLDDGIHYILSVEKKILVTESHDLHKVDGEWWWKGRVPCGVTIDDFYLDNKKKYTSRKNKTGILKTIKNKHHGE